MEKFHVFTFGVLGLLCVFILSNSQRKFFSFQTVLLVLFKISIWNRTQTLHKSFKSINEQILLDLKKIP